MPLEKLQSRLEELDGVELVTFEERDDWGGTVLCVTISSAYEGKGDSLLEKVLDEIPRDVLDLDVDPDERFQVYYDMIEIRL